MQEVRTSWIVNQRIIGPERDNWRNDAVSLYGSAKFWRQKNIFLKRLAHGYCTGLENWQHPIARLIDQQTS